MEAIVLETTTKIVVKKYEKEFNHYAKSFNKFVSEVFMKTNFRHFKIVRTPVKRASVKKAPFFERKLF